MPDDDEDDDRPLPAPSGRAEDVLDGKFPRGPVGGDARYGGWRASSKVRSMSSNPGRTKGRSSS
jgi:hypothetical protein